MTIFQRPPALLALPLALCCACATPGDGIDEVPSEDITARDYCPELDAGPLTTLADDARAVVAGPCGDLLYEVDDAAFWYRPGHAPVEVDADTYTTAFAPTGHLMAWELALEPGLVLADTRTGERVTLPNAHTFGLVPAPDTDHGADLWTCTDDLLELAGPVESAIVAENVDCSSVVGSSGTARVAFADHDGVVMSADLESLALWTLDDTGYLAGRSDAEGRNRNDSLWIGYDGLTVVHQLSYLEPYDDGHNEIQRWIEAQVFTAGTSIANWSGDVSVRQASSRNAPVVLRSDAGLSAVAEGLRYDHSDVYAGLHNDARGRVVTYTDAGDQLVRMDLDGASLEVLAETTDLAEHHVSPSGEWIAVEQRSDGPGTLRMWHEGEGLRPAVSEAAGWQLLAVTDHGQVLAEDSFENRLLLLDAELQIQATRELSPLGRVRTLELLDDGRMVIELSTSDDKTLLISDLQGGLTQVEGSGQIDPDKVWVGAHDQTLAFVDVGPEGNARLVAGAMPGL